MAKKAITPKRATPKATAKATTTPSQKEQEQMAAVQRDAKGRFIKGGGSGRKKGQINIATSKLRNWIAEFIETNTSSLEQDFKELTPKERFDVIIALLPYVTAKKKEVTMDAQVHEAVNLREGISNINKVFGIQDNDIDDAEVEEL